MDKKITFSSLCTSLICQRPQQSFLWLKWQLQKQINRFLRKTHSKKEKMYINGPHSKLHVRFEWSLAFVINIITVFIKLGAELFFSARFFYLAPKPKWTLAALLCACLRLLHRNKRCSERCAVPTNCHWLICAPRPILPFTKRTIIGQCIQKRFGCHPSHSKLSLSISVDSQSTKRCVCT